MFLCDVRSDCVLAWSRVAVNDFISGKLYARAHKSLNARVPSLYPLKWTDRNKLFQLYNCASGLVTKQL